MTLVEVSYQRSEGWVGTVTYTVEVERVTDILKDTGRTDMINAGGRHFGTLNYLYQGTLAIDGANLQTNISVTKEYIDDYSDPWTSCLPVKSPLETAEPSRRTIYSRTVTSGNWSGEGEMVVSVDATGSYTISIGTWAGGGWSPKSIPMPGEYTRQVSYAGGGCEYLNKPATVTPVNSQSSSEQGFGFVIKGEVGEGDPQNVSNLVGEITSEEYGRQGAPARITWDLRRN
jgi:hypothetical protein